MTIRILYLVLPLLLAVGSAAQAAQITYEFSIDSLTDVSSAGAGFFDGGSASGTLTIDHDASADPFGPGAFRFPSGLVALDITLTSLSTDVVAVDTSGLFVLVGNDPFSAVIARALLETDLGPEVLPLVTITLGDESPGVFPADTIPILDPALFPDEASLLIGDFTGGFPPGDRTIRGDFTTFAQVPVAGVPEPGAALLFATGALVMARATRRHRA